MLMLNYFAAAFVRQYSCTVYFLLDLIPLLLWVDSPPTTDLYVIFQVFLSYLIRLFRMYSCRTVIFQMVLGGETPMQNDSAVEMFPVLDFCFWAPTSQGL